MSSRSLLALVVAAASAGPAAAQSAPPVTTLTPYPAQLKLRGTDDAPQLLVPGLLLLHEEHARAAAAHTPLEPRQLWWGYLWLLAGSGYFFARCLADLALVRRPALDPNLNRP